MIDKRKYYRIVFADEPTVSPCPDERWDNENDLLKGIMYWEGKTGRTVKVIEEAVEQKS